ncbi:DUF2142 domain-containing protein [Enterococcus sp. SMC-9]|uniref:DUF2142 domain-containing protein n=1 Tax=Enterococcus sp. SMC-9 TaxID=2862343 RepID=UPI001E65693E|nr:DUF2142 domain-containing protein [Enterococcus sp. SMC-9]MCD1023596.1 DUF2142 domain-containing protein [Enterococcus sp. SMC-9]
MNNLRLDFFKNRWFVLSCFLVAIIGGGYSTGFRQFDWWPIFFIFFVGAAAVLFLTSELEWVSLAIIALFGTLFVFLSPIFDVLDEPAHYARAEYVAEGNFFLSNDKSNLKISKDYELLEKQTGYNGINRLKPKKNLMELNLFEIEHNSKETIETKIKATRPYGTLMYLPSALGIFLGRIFTGNLGVMFYLGRWMNLFVYALMSFFAIKKAGNFKLILAFFSIQHLPVYISASFSQDAIFYGLILLIISKYASIFCRDNKIELKDLIYLMVLCCLMAMSKLPYVALIGLLIFIPIKKYKNIKLYFLSFGVCLVVLIFSLLWIKIYSSITPDDLPKQVNESLQLKHIMEHPRYFLNSLSSGVVESVLKIKQYFSFGWSYYYSEIATFISLILAGAVILFSPLQFVGRVNKFFKIAVILVSFAIIILTNIIMYLSFTGVGEKVINGVQGRYFFGILVFSPFYLNQSHKFFIGNIEEVVDESRIAQLILGFSILLLVWMATMRIGAYY